VGTTSPSADARPLKALRLMDSRGSSCETAVIDYHIHNCHSTTTEVSDTISFAEQLRTSQHPDDDLPVTNCECAYILRISEFATVQSLPV